VTAPVTVAGWRGLLAAWLRARRRASRWRRAVVGLVDADPAQLSESGQRLRRDALRARRAFRGGK